MDLTPKQLIEDVEFREVRRGYDPAEVDAFLDRVAAAMTKLHQQLGEANARAQAAEARAAAAPAAAPTAAPAADPAVGTEQLQRTLILAQRTADAAVKEAQDEAEGLRSGAAAEAERIVADAHSEAEQHARAAREASEAELRELEGVRQALIADVALLERHVDTQRSGVAQAIAELQRFLDNPETLRVQPLEELSDVQLPVAEPVVVATGPGAEDTSADTAALPTIDPAPAAEEWAPAPEVTIAPEVPSSPPPPVVEAANEWSADPAPSFAFEAPAPEPEPPAPAAPADELIDLDAAWAAPEPAAAEPAAVVEDPPTQPVEVASAGEPETDDSDDAFLAELRKAMTDDEPLGPRDEDHEHATPTPLSNGPAADARPRPRFGRRR